MTAADDAYRAAEVEIARVKDAGETVLRFDAQPYRALTTLPPQIAEMTGLEVLDLDNTQVADIAPVAGLTNLQGLYLTDTQVADIAPVAGLTNLQGLYLNITQVADIAPVAGLTNLQRLYLGGTQVADIAPVARLTKLQTLYLTDTQVADIAPVAGLTNLQGLYLNITQVADIAPVAGLTNLQALSLNNTQVADIAPVAGLTNLQGLYLNNTQVADIAPVAGLTNLQGLYLNNTQVADLRPILGLTALGTGDDGGVWYAGSAACAKDATLARISKVEEDDARMEQTLAHLRSLPPWPEPLPFDPPTEREAGPPIPPEPEGGMRMQVFDGLLELVRTPHGEDADPLRNKSFDRLKRSVTDLVRHGNRYPELRVIAESLLSQTDGTLAEASLYDIHLDVAALTDLIDGNPSRPEAERFDTDALTTMQTVVRVGPPLTIDDPEVEAFEAATAKYKGQDSPETAKRGEVRVVESLANGPDGIGPELQDMAQRIASQPVSDGRMATQRRVISRNTVIYAGLAVGTAGLSLVAVITEEAAKLAWSQAPALWNFLVVNKDSIMAAAGGWGSQAQVWVADLLARAIEISNLVHKRRR